MERGEKKGDHGSTMRWQIHRTVLKEEHTMSRFVTSLLQRLAHHSRMRQQRNPLQYSMDRPFFGNLVAR